MPAPIANKSSVADGESEIMRFGYVVAACDGIVDSEIPINADKESIEIERLNIKKLPQTLREEVGLLRARPSSEVGYNNNLLGDLAKFFTFARLKHLQLRDSAGI